MAGGAREQDGEGARRGMDPTLAPVPRPLFLHRDTYRRRRIMDAARLLPLFGTALMLLPMLWADDHSTGLGAVYLFLAWAGLIATAALLARKLSEPLRRPGAPRPGEAEE